MIKTIEIYGLLDAQKENNQKEIQLFRNKLKSSTFKLEKINEDVKEIVKKNNLMQKLMIKIISSCLML